VRDAPAKPSISLRPDDTEISNGPRVIVAQEILRDKRAPQSSVRQSSSGEYTYVTRPKIGEWWASIDFPLPRYM
jgi:hypothetical protein